MADDEVPDGRAADGLVEDLDGAATPIGGRSGREARLDLVLAEELANDVGLLRKLVGEVDRDRKGVNLPSGDPTLATVRLNVDEYGLELDSWCRGETDIEVLASWTDRSVPILVEDKLWASFQDLQPERYVGRAESRGGAAVLVAPKDFLAAHSVDAAKFHGCLEIEEVIKWLRREDSDSPSEVKRRKWRASLLEELIQRPVRRVAVDHEPTMAFTAFCVTWLKEADARAQPGERSLRTAGQGWLGFTSPPGLVYKASGWARKDKAAVDLYLRYHGFTGDLATLERLLRGLPPLEGFFATTDTAKNVVLRHLVEVVLPDEGMPVEGSAREASVVEALEACKRAAAWIAENEPRLADGRTRAG